MEGKGEVKRNTEESDNDAVDDCDDDGDDNDDDDGHMGKIYCQQRQVTEGD